MCFGISLRLTGIFTKGNNSCNILFAFLTEVSLPGYSQHFEGKNFFQELTINGRRGKIENGRVLAHEGEPTLRYRYSQINVRYSFSFVRTVAASDLFFQYILG